MSNRVASIPELVKMIFSYNSSTANYYCALASSAFRDVALELLWKSLDNIVGLFNLLGPLMVKEEAEFVHSIVVSHG